MRCQVPLPLLLRLVAAVLVLSWAPAWAQYRVDTWTRDDGLPTNSVTSVVQARDGFLWIATYGGLLRFDGRTLQRYGPDNTPGLRTGRIFHLQQTSDGALWMITEGMGATRLHQGRFRTFTVRDGLPSDNVGAVFEHPPGTVLVDTAAGVVEWREGTFVRRGGLPSFADRDKVIVARSDDGITWYVDERGLHRFEGGAVTRSLSRPAETITRAYEDRSGRLWLHLWDEGRSGARTLASLDAGGALVRYSAADGVPYFDGTSWSEDRDGNVWIGLRGNGGVLRFDGARFTRLSIEDGLPGRNVERPYQDREGSLWLPTDGGLARLTARVMRTYSTADGLAAANTYPIYEDRQGDIWIGGWSGLTRSRGGRFTIVSEEFGLVDRNVTSITEDRDGALWIGTWTSGLRRFKDGRVTRYPPRSNGDIVRAIHQARDGDLWFGGSLGLMRYRDGVFTDVTAEDGYPGGEVHAILEDRHGFLWFGLTTGVLRFANGAFTPFDDGGGVTGGPVRTIYEDRHGTLWFGTYDTGLYRYKDGRLTHFTRRQGLFDNGVFQIVEDRDDRFWICSNAGIYRVSRGDLDALAEGRLAELTSIAYGERDGMLDAECNGGTQPAGLIARDGRIWMPTQGGAVVFDPSAIGTVQVPPPVTITEVLVADRPVEDRSRVEIRSGPTSLQVRFAALTFVRPELSRFKFRMEGLDDRWTEAGRDPLARYAQLPYGAFTFRVIAANRDGVWNETGAALQVVVVPPFWRTGWFMTLSVLLLSASGLAVHVWRMKLLRRQQELQQAFSEQLIASQESERRRIAAGLHDGLSQSLVVIKNWALLARQALGNEGAARTRLEEIEATAARALDEVREIVHDLTPYQLERLGLAMCIEEMVEHVAGASGITFECRTGEVDARLPKANALGLFRVVQEAANNIVKHSGASHASIDVAVGAGRLRTVIRDNGRGFDAEGAAGTPLRGGFGLLGMAERVRIMGGHIEVRTSPGHGTSITIDLPVNEVGTNES